MKELGPLLQEIDALIREHGKNAEREAAREAKSRREAGDLEGFQTWEQIRQFMALGRIGAELSEQPPASRHRSALPVSSEAAEAIAVAERMKQDLRMAIAAERLLAPIAADKQLIDCFNVGFSAVAFELMRHAILFYEVMAMMRLWDRAENDTRSIPTLARLLSGESLAAQLAERERQATHDIRQFEIPLGDGEGIEELPFPVGRSTPSERERDLRTRLSSWQRKVRDAKGRAEISRLRKFRHEVHAHSAGLSRMGMIKLPKYGDEQKVLEETIPIVSEGFLLATGTYYDFSTTKSNYNLVQEDMWGIIRSAARGARYAPPQRKLDQLVPVVTGKASKASIAIKGQVDPRRSLPRKTT